MRFLNVVSGLILAVLAVTATGCGSISAHLMARAPNRYPDWFSSGAPVTLGFSSALLTNITRHYVDVGPPSARLCYRIIEPANYGLKITSTNWMQDGRKQFEFNFHAALPGQPNQWTGSPRGTVVLLHGYGLAQFSMLPWALKLGQEGWRCILVDLRGHGRSSGKQIYFGAHEVNDLIQLLNQVAQENELKKPVAVMGESYGAALSLRWKGVDPRIQAAVAIAPYASLSNAVLNLRHDYANWMPPAFIKAGLTRLPKVLDVPPSEFDTTTAMKRNPVTALFIAGAEDTIAPPAEVKRLKALALPDSKLVVVPEATHEALTYFFSDLDAPVTEWLTEQK